LYIYTKPSSLTKKGKIIFGPEDEWTAFSGTATQILFFYEDGLSVFQKLLNKTGLNKLREENIGPGLGKNLF